MQKWTKVIRRFSDKVTRVLVILGGSIKRTTLFTFALVVIYAMAVFEGVNALDYDYGKGQKYDIPLREISVIVTPEGYYPSTISAFAGEKVRFFVTSITNRASCFILSSKGVFMTAKKGMVSETEVVFTNKGTYKFHCPTGKIKGHITILKKESAEDKANRRMASEKVRVWFPREE